MGCVGSRWRRVKRDIDPYQSVPGLIGIETMSDKAQICRWLHTTECRGARGEAGRGSMRWRMQGRMRRQGLQGGGITLAGAKVGQSDQNERGWWRRKRQSVVDQMEPECGFVVVAVRIA